jgi:hypothetical protein
MKNNFRRLIARDVAIFSSIFVRRIHPMSLHTFVAPLVQKKALLGQNEWGASYLGGALCPTLPYICFKVLQFGKAWNYTHS